jgi:hypothetical protein
MHKIGIDIWHESFAYVDSFWKFKFKIFNILNYFFISQIFIQVCLKITYFYSQGANML